MRTPDDLPTVSDTLYVTGWEPDVNLCYCHRSLQSTHTQTASWQWWQNSTNPLDENLLIVCTHARLFGWTRSRNDSTVVWVVIKSCTSNKLVSPGTLCCGTVFYDNVHVMIIRCLISIACQPPTASTHKSQRGYRLQRNCFIKILVLEDESSNRQYVSLLTYETFFCLKSPGKMAPKPPELHCSRNWF